MREEDVRELLRLWVEKLNLQLWKIDLRFVDGPPIGSERNYLAVGTADIRWEYLTAIISLDRVWYSRATQDQGESNIVHELLHILLAEALDRRLGPAAQELQEERAVSTIARILMRAKKEEEEDEHLRTD